MKHLLTAFLLCTLTFSAFAQTESTQSATENTSIENAEKIDDWNKKLKPIEIEMTRGAFFIPKFSANWYFSEKVIFKLSALDLGPVSLGKTTRGNDFEIATFLEFRKYLNNSKTYFSHGPTLAYEFDKNEQDIKSHTFKAGYNLGVGYRLSKNITTGTYISPYISYNDGNIDVLHGRLFMGSLKNIYLAYRF